MPGDRKYFLCDECKRAFDEKIRKPLLLPCGHVCCRQCVSRREDRDDTSCPQRDCKQDWSSSNVSDLQTVYDLIPKFSSQRGREVTPSVGAREVTPSSVGGREVAPAVPFHAATRREVEPMVVDGYGSNDDCASVSSEGSSRSLAVTECCLCMEGYNRLDNRPVLLSCGHVSCLACLEMLEGIGRVNCPRCRKMWPKGALRNLPVVSTLVRPDNWNKKSSKKTTSFSLQKRACELESEWKMSSEKKKGEKVQVFVESCGKTESVFVDLERDTVRDMKDRLSSGSGHGSSYRTIHDGRTMGMNSRLADHNVQSGSTIRETPRLYGGHQF